MGKKNKKNKKKKQQEKEVNINTSQDIQLKFCDLSLKAKSLSKQEREKVSFFDASKSGYPKFQIDSKLVEGIEDFQPMNFMEDVYCSKYETEKKSFDEVPTSYYNCSCDPVVSQKKAYEKFTSNNVDDSVKGYINFANFQTKVKLPNAWGNQKLVNIPKTNLAKEVPDVINVEMWPEQKKVNDWDLIADPEIAKAKNQGEYTKKKFFAGDMVAVWYTNDFYVGKITHIAPKINQTTVHIPYWDYEKDKEEKHLINVKPDQIYSLHTFDEEGREHKSEIKWRVGDFCWAWLAEERDYYAAWYQGPDRSNPNDQNIVFDTYEEDGIYLIPKHFVIPAYMFDDQYLDYHIENDQDVVVDQSKTYAEKAAKILRRSRRLRKMKGENKYYYEEDDYDGGTRWNGVVGKANVGKQKKNGNNQKQNCKNNNFVNNRSSAQKPVFMNSTKNLNSKMQNLNLH